MAERSPLVTDLGHAIRDARHALRMSQEELALRTGVHRNYIGGIERGERNPTVTKIGELAEGLGVAPSELLAHAGH